jgi:hypothetical protein
MSFLYLCQVGKGKNTMLRSVHEWSYYLYFRTHHAHFPLDGELPGNS